MQFRHDKKNDGMLIVNASFGYGIEFSICPLNSSIVRI